MDAFGFYPTNTLKGVVSAVTTPTVPSRIANEFLERGGVQDGECILSVQVDEEIYQQAHSILREYRGKGYALREQDCVTFAAAVAAAVGLSVPDRGSFNSKLPAQFIRELSEANPPAHFLNGTWVSTDPQKRFRVIIRGRNCDWLDQPKEGQQIRAQTTLRGNPPIFTLERNNDDRVLALLGFQPALRQAILSRSPAPSVLQLVRDGDRLNGVWKGLVAIKDDKARLKNLEFRESQWQFVRASH